MAILCSRKLFEILEVPPASMKNKPMIRPSQCISHRHRARTALLGENILGGGSKTDSLFFMHIRSPGIQLYAPFLRMPLKISRTGHAHFNTGIAIRKQSRGRNLLFFGNSVVREPFVLENPL